MLWLICVIAGMIITPIIFEFCEGYWDFLHILLGAFLGLVVSLILLVPFSVALEDEPMTTYEYTSTELISLNDGLSTDINGIFFLGIGNISSSGNLEYRFIYRDEKGLRVGERTASRVYLEYIENDESPRLVKYKTKYDNKFWNWLLGSVDSWEVFYIPEGSITDSIIIDLQ